MKTVGKKIWFSYKPELWGHSTHKVYDDRWKAPEGAKLACEVRSVEKNRIVVGLDEYAAEVQLDGQSQWQTVALTPHDFVNASGAPLAGWSGIKELRLGAEERLSSKDRRKDRALGGDWKGPKPEFRNLRWLTESP